MGLKGLNYSKLMKLSSRFFALQSLSLTPARPRPGHAASGGSSTGIADDSDAESVKSYGSACSTASACDHATFALNGTTWSGRSRKYVVHCSNHTGDNEQYLTPTQRAARQVRKFQVKINIFFTSLEFLLNTL